MKELENLRAEIDDLDNELLKVLSRRFAVTRKIGEIKRLNKLGATDELRLNEILQHWNAEARNLGIDQDLVESILMLMHEGVVKEHKNNFQ